MSDLKPNIILVICDQLKASALSVYGNVDAKTPVLDKCAKAGMVFNRFYANCPLCVPSRGDLLTGVYSHNRHVRNNNHPINPGDDNIAGRLRGAGYRTALVGKNHFCNDADTGGCGFDDFLSVDYAHIYPEKGFTFCGRDNEEFSTRKVTESACEYINGHQGKEPLFMIVSYPKPHTPYTVPAPYDKMYDPDKISLPPSWNDDILENKEPRHFLWSKASGMADLSERQKRELLAVYYGMLSEIDDYMKHLIEAAKALSGPVVFLFTSDHGDYMGEHGMLEKNAALYDALTHIPLIMWGDGVLSGDGCNALLEMVDLYPTLAELAGLEVPEYCNGNSFNDILKGKTEAHRKYAFAEWNFEGDTRLKEWKWEKGGEDNSFKAYGRIKSIRDKEWKLIYYANGYMELYNTMEDPWERHNRAGEKEAVEIASRLKEAMLQRMIDSELKYPPLGRMVWYKDRGFVCDQIDD